MSAYRSAHATCDVHPGIVAERACCKCGASLCEPCCAFIVNDDVWCETCGAALEGEGRGARAVSFVLMVAVPLLVGAVVVTAQARWGKGGVLVAAYALAGVFGLLAQVGRLRRLRRGPRIAHSPAIVRRKRGDALPRPRPRSLGPTPGPGGARGGRLRA